MKKTLPLMISHATGRGMRTRVVSNASWAISVNKARTAIERLVEAGLNGLDVSYDDFHLPYIDHRQIRNVFEGSLGAGLDSFLFMLCEAKDTVVDPAYLADVLGVELPVVADRRQLTGTSCRRLRGTSYGVSNSVLLRLGQAKEQLPPDAFLPLSLNHAMWNSPCPSAMRDIAITPANTVVPCCGAEFAGNEFMDLGPADDLGTRYDELARTDLVRLIGIAGPNFVQKLVDRVSGQALAASEPGQKSICEICENLSKDPRNVRALRRLIADGELGLVADDFERRRAQMRQAEEPA